MTKIEIDRRIFSPWFLLSRPCILDVRDHNISNGPHVPSISFQQ